MKQVEERYISLLTDFGFKRIFGTAMNKDLLICFLNSLFNGRQVVKDVSYLNPEHVGDVYTDRKAISDNIREGILEIPLYTEKFYVYLAESCWRKLPVFKPENLEYENMWIMKEAQCLRNSAFSFCKARSKGHHIYEAGSIETLIRIVDENGGFTIIPEMHLPFLSEEQRRHVRKIEGDYLSQRRISLYIREDYIRERMLNTLVDTLKMFIPEEMMVEGIRKYGIKL